MKIAGFDWDDGNWPKCGKHGAAKAEIEQVIAEARFMVDDRGEKRLRTAGKTSSGRYVFVAFAFRAKPGGQFVRPISARYMHREEIEFYEKEMARLEER